MVEQDDLVGLVAPLAEEGIPVAGRVGPVDPVADSPHPEELATVASSVPKRRNEHLTGRSLARLALADLGMDAGAIVRRDDRSPAWPPGIGGSITHTDGLCAVVVARLPEGWGVGIDAEVDEPLAAAVTERVLGPSELDRLGARLDQDGVVAFSAKESVFKAVNPLTGRWLEPHDIEITLHDDGSASTSADDSHAGGWFDVAFCGRGRRALADLLPAGRWLRSDRWVATACILRPGSATADAD
jgi:4'-phosphopantetheinyl transferase EntD